MPDSRILLGVIGRPHGVRGLVRVSSHTADPADLTAYGPLTDAQGRHFVLRWRGEGLAEISEIVGDTPVKVTDRSAAEKLTNTRLYIDRGELPEPEEDEYYLADLIGLTAVDPAGTPFGRVSAVHDYGAGASLEIERKPAAPLLVPFTHACVPDIDLSAGQVTVAPPIELDVAVEADRDASPLAGARAAEPAGPGGAQSEPTRPRSAAA